MARLGLHAFVGTAAIFARHRCCPTADAAPTITSRKSNFTSLANVPPRVANRCSSFDLASFGKAKHCGSPWSAPCFDYSRCRDNKSIYVYDENCTLADSSKITEGMSFHLRRAAQEAGMLAESYQDACMFIMQNKFREVSCATSAPLWNDGVNHVMFDITDPSRDQRPYYYDSYAMEAATSQHTCHYRNGFDISVGHTPKVVFHDLQTTSPDTRRYFLTFRGTIYFNRHGYEERASILNLHDPERGVVVAEKCSNDRLHRGPEQFRQFCAEEMMPRYEAFDFEDLMNTTFALVPGGGSPGTHRLAEASTAGAIPVIVVRDWVKPFPEKVDWSSFSFTFSPDEVPQMLEVLRSLPLAEIEEMQREAIEAYWKIYGGITNYSWICGLTIEILGERLGYHRA
ncbi:unnamed protein product [Ectocarpus sp. 13 AM-2016]